MATKDWTRFGKANMWWNNKKNVGIGVIKNTVSWTRGYWGSKSTKDIKTCKTKAKAIAYAKDYMKTH